jgi:hypothetical protein
MGSKGNSGLWRCPSSSNFYPFGETAALFAFHIHNISITPASATDAVLLDGVNSRPVFIFFNSRLLINRGLFQIWNSGQLSRRRICRTVLDRRVTIAKITEVVDIAGR